MATDVNIINDARAESLASKLVRGTAFEEIQDKAISLNLILLDVCLEQQIRANASVCEICAQSLQSGLSLDEQFSGESPQHVRSLYADRISESCACIEVEGV